MNHIFEYNPMLYRHTGCDKLHSDEYRLILNLLYIIKMVFIGFFLLHKPEIRNNSRTIWIDITLNDVIANR